MTAELNAEEMTAALIFAAKLEDRPTLSAATHLLLFTDLPTRASFAKYVELESVEDEDEDGVERLGAWPKWRELTEAAGAGEFRLDGDKRRLLQLAASYAAGEPVDLRGTAGMEGHAHAKAAIEAALIAHGVTGYYSLTDGPELERLRQFHAQMDARG